ncbi:major facilitator superfamily domain-containing protein [Pseudomassariella vexata]|uniref:Probable transporter MCH1 n=1 Tax=Pseudomassariella vexata TaxID=1141098 RepID=A0A1Y2DAD6_9PEZI|nr:major facilitator superfamily domain-containing protein [Pseudomassariella vexata]ORY56157.1 major facilitator superfamily domain-containing protein [Pseudomassariella vexata]
MASQQSSPDQPGAPLIRSPSTSTLGPASSQSSIRDSSSTSSTRRTAQLLRTISFVSAILSSMGAGSITVFSLYGPRFQSQLHFSQFEINGIASAMSISMYIPVPLLGYICDRVGPSPLSLLAVVLLGTGYGLAAALYHKGEIASSAGERNNHGIVPYMVLAFVLIGVGTVAMYLSSITTCAKNFGKGKHRGLMLVAPIASFGLSGMVVSQIGSRLLYTRLPDGSKGEVNVFHFFLFLAILLVVVGLSGAFALRIVDEDELIDQAVEELERSGFLEGSTLLSRGRSERSYGATDSAVEDPSDEAMLDSGIDGEDEDNSKFKKTYLLNAETRRFLSDRTMWWFALGFWLIIGPGEAFLNNLGTVIGTLYSPGSNDNVTSAATHVSIVAITSTVARLLSGSLSDLLSPSPHSSHYQAGLDSSLPSLRRKLSVSRIALILAAGIILSIGTMVLATGFVQDHGDRFWIVSSLVGAGYGAVFSLTPIIVTMIWGVENFGTNFGIIAVFPAIGSTMWGLTYSAVYQMGAKKPPSMTDGADDDVFCYGEQCYSSTFWAMTFSIWIGCGMILWTWKGRDGWTKRGVVI